jgi:hypothetical protein
VVGMVYLCASLCSRVVSAITAVIIPATTADYGPGLLGTGKIYTATAKYSSCVMMIPRCP